MFELEAMVVAWTSAHSTDEIIAAMERARVPCGKVADIAEVLENPQLRHREQIIDVEHPKAGPVPMQSFVTKLSETPAKVRRPAPGACLGPRVGAHGDVARDGARDC